MCEFTHCLHVPGWAENCLLACPFFGGETLKMWFLTWTHVIQNYDTDFWNPLHNYTTTYIWSGAIVVEVYQQNNIMSSFYGCIVHQVLYHRNNINIYIVKDEHLCKINYASKIVLSRLGSYVLVILPVFNSFHNEQANMALNFYTVGSLIPYPNYNSTTSSS